ncbi:MAG: hypothetical protein WC082_02320 [Victivallales bacterium]
MGTESGPGKCLCRLGCPRYSGEAGLDLLPDRQDFAAPEMPESGKKTFINWINNIALPKLRKHIVDQAWRNDSEEVFELHEEVFHALASCKKSYGYCYILCWQKK